ncbi:10571_t:CDS:1 [Ambispora gerdemannii]|uniref:10571_t:CDS:1 n=1 Tax=Ambispora gerdemannii TaxID=144530 RepID=A0A9N9BFK7_9GLOM|nr:10571_t:CDS:1 [Ambispora gerdemannii]
MFKPISNSSGNRTSICSQVETGKIIANKLYCCAKDNKNCSLTSDCFGNNFEVAQCHTLNNFDACKRTDLAAIQVCGGLQNSLLCLSVDTSSKNYTEYYRFPKAAEWIVNRSSEAETNNITVCDDGTSYRPCNTSNPNGTIANLTCGDLFQSEHRCNWRNITNGEVIADLPRKPIVELCGVGLTTTVISTTTTTTTAVSHDNDNDKPVIIGLAIGIGVLGIIAALAFFNIYKLRRRIRHINVEVSSNSASINGDTT